MTPDLQEIMVLIADSMNVSPSALFRKMSQEEMQQMQQRTEMAPRRTRWPSSSSGLTRRRR
jgi:hypothetical protein